jgi:hypothetical protein
MRNFGVLSVGLMFLCAAAPLGAQAATKAKASSVCKDGTTSTAEGRGACSGHGGVDSVATAAAKASRKAAKADAKAAKAKTSKNPDKLAAADAAAKKADNKAEKAEERAAHDSVGATAQCKDGTFSHAATMQGACSRHGGVARTMKR